MTVNVEDEGQTGIIDEYEQALPDEKKILIRKGVPSIKKQNEKKDTNTKPKPVHEDLEEAEYEDEKQQSQGSTRTEDSEIHDDSAEDIKNASPLRGSKAVESPILDEKIPNRKIIEDKFEIVSIGNRDKQSKKISDEGTFDFVDTPLDDSVLKPAGTSQASRVNIKKATNGQDYEYEYVYYYYDDEEDPANSKNPKTGTNSKDVANKGSKNTQDSHEGSAIRTTTQAPNTRLHYSTISDPTPDLSEATTESSLSGYSSRTLDNARDDDHLQSASNAANPKQRYTTIERTRGHPSERVNAALSTPEPASNEVLPTRGSRSRGRQLPSSSEEVIAPVSEERLPANTRFPPRSRSNHNSNVNPTTLGTDTLNPRSRGNTSETEGIGCYYYCERRRSMLIDKLIEDNNLLRSILGLSNKPLPVN